MKPWIKDLLVAFAGTTLSIILTFGTSALIDHVNRNKDRRLTALMVLSSIESSVRELEESGKIMARKDTVAHWLLDLTLSDVRTLPEEILSDGEVRAQLGAIGQRREWLKYITFALRENNRKNMALIGIPEEEVMAFTDERTLDTDDDAVNEAFFRGEFSIPAISLDSLTTMKPYNDLLDSLRRP